MEKNSPQLQVRPRSQWRDVWAAWCPTCRQECIPLDSGICGWCNTKLDGQPTRGPLDAPLTEEEAGNGLLLRDLGRRLAPNFIKAA